MLKSTQKARGSKVDIQAQQKEAFKNLRHKIKGILSTQKGQVITNIHNGMQASISSDGINKLISSKAVDKSIANGYTKEEHFASVENVLNLYRSSQFVQSEPLTNKSPDVIAYHKFIVDFSIDHKPTKAKITLKESIHAGNRIYSLELLQLKKLADSPTATQSCY